MVAWIKELHDTYGDAVRVAPGEVSFTSGETAWPEIYGFRTGKYKDTGAYLKDPAWFPKPINGVSSLTKPTMPVSDAIYRMRSATRLCEIKKALFKDM
jgi:hypothetical protein